MVNRACYFCGKPDGLETHHIVPRRYNGTDKEENLVDLCSNCHTKIERLYDKRFYRRIGIEEPKTEIGYAGEQDVDKIRFNQRPKIRENGWKIGYNQNQLQPICPECNNLAKVTSVAIGPDRETAYLCFGCSLCQISGEKQFFSTPKLDSEDFAFEELFREINPQDVEAEANLKETMELEQWYALGDNMKDLKSHMMTMLRSGVPKSYTEEFRRIYDRLEDARSELEERFFEEYSDQADIKTFYGAGKKLQKSEGVNLE